MTEILAESRQIFDPNSRSFWENIYLPSYTRRTFCLEPPLWSKQRASQNDTPIWPFIIIAIVAFLVWSEYGSQDCREQSCNNRAEITLSSDSSLEIIDKISMNVIRNHTIVDWRRSLLVAIIIGLVILLIFVPQFPDGFTVLITVFIVFLIVYFSSAWFSSHWWKMNDYKIDQSLQNFHNRLLSASIL